MYSQSAETAAYANYVTDYIGACEDLPSSIQRKISQIHELDIRFGEFTREIKEAHEALRTNEEKKPHLLKLHKLLIEIQQVQDEKIEIVQQIQDMVETKGRQLEKDKILIAQSLSQECLQEVKPFDSQPERSSKRLRKQRTDGGSYEEIIPKDSYEPKKSKRKKKKGSGSLVKLEDSLISPDEPRYCNCNQISYGEMVFCEKEGCTKEWFHFECVGLKTKPKGKWYCPNCRSDKNNHLKSK